MPLRTFGPRLVAALLASALLFWTPLAHSARQLPADAHFGQITGFQYPLVAFGSRVLRMGPGARIYNQQNLIIVPAAMPHRAAVLFKLDFQGQISGIWLLTAQEAARLKNPQAKPVAPAQPPSAVTPEAADDPSRLGRN